MSNPHEAVLLGEPFQVTAAVCKTNRIMSDPIDRHIKIFAMHCRRYGRDEIIYFPPGAPGGLFPGLFRGGCPVLSPKYA